MPPARLGLTFAAEAGFTMDRTLVAVLGAAVGAGVLLAVAVAKNERSFTQRLYAESPAVVETSSRPASNHAVAAEAPLPTLAGGRARPTVTVP
jgi:hypothetical protein